VSISAFFRLPDAGVHIHPLGRFCFSLGLFAAVLLMNRDFPVLLFFLVGSLLLLRWLCSTWQPLLRAARLLLWLLVPILLLHLLFTPGQLLWPGSIVPFTREGLYAGVWLGLHLCTLFYAAMLLSRSLSQEEWVWYCLQLPRIGPRLLPYVKLSAPLRALVGRGMAEARQQLYLSKGIRELPRLLHVITGLIARIWHDTEKEAEAVWRNWDELVVPGTVHSGLLPALLLALCGLLMPVAVWIS
jgi:hypothetical protein